MADRIAMVLPHIISQEQIGFIKDRGIIDNVLLAPKMIYKLDSKVRGSNVILKLDMAKAYDRLFWLFLLKTLKGFGF